MHDDAARRGRRRWFGLALCTILFLLLAPGLGAASVPVAVLGMMLGVERAYYLWQMDRRMLSAAIGIWLGLWATSMVVPIWGHSAAVYGEEGKKTVRHHDHYLWELDHIH